MNSVAEYENSNFFPSGGADSGFFSVCRALAISLHNEQGCLPLKVFSRASVSGRSCE